MSDGNGKHEITHPQKRGFLVAFAKCGNVTVAAEAIKMRRENHYDWLRNDKDGSYEAAFDVAREEAIERMEAEAQRRAMYGVRRPVTYQGQVVRWKNPQTGKREVLYEHRFSDILLIFLLKGAKPEKYRDRHEISGPDGGPLQVENVRLDIRRIMAHPKAFELLTQLADVLAVEPVIDMAEGKAPEGLPGGGNSKGAK